MPLPTKNKKLSSVYLGMLLALSLILSYVEVLLPLQTGIPGIKLGLSNLAVIYCLYILSIRDAVLLSITKSILCGILFGNPMMILYSLSGALLSSFVMYLLRRSNAFHVPVISMVGGVMHNIGQLLVACLFVQTYSILYYVPVLLISGIIMGGILGSVSALTLPYIEKLSNRGMQL